MSVVKSPQTFYLYDACVSQDPSEFLTQCKAFYCGATGIDEICYEKCKRAELKANSVKYNFP